jgi:hypothetical protein
MLEVLLRIIGSAVILFFIHSDIKGEEWVFLGDYPDGKFYYNEETVGASQQSITLHLKLIHSAGGKKFLLEGAKAFTTRRLAENYESLEYSIHEVKMSCPGGDYQITRSTYYSSDGRVILDSQRTKSLSAGKDLSSPIDELYRRFCQ